MERTASVLQDTQERVRSVAEEAQRTLQEEMRPDNQSGQGPQSAQGASRPGFGSTVQHGSTTSSPGMGGQGR
jgi:hypothetical protein